MIRSVASKVMWVGRATVFLVGLAVILALVVGVTSTAFGANGQALVLGSVNNAATALTKLTGNVDGAAVQVVNSNAGTDDTALALNVQRGELPLRVNSDRLVPNLNAAYAGTADRAEQVDGSEGELWAQILADGGAWNWKGMTGNVRVGTGRYNISFNRDVSECAYSTSVVQPAIKPDPGFVTTVPALDGAEALIIDTYNASGVHADRPFHVVVFCGEHESAN